ncbi:hypothetical protein [Ancylobacter sp. IITR112]|uniref:hypothetical protein n=1 Tax=Ancylobacter sp. IITR112 TaxID=3138073 RepID=UPI00352B33F6
MNRIMLPATFLAVLLLAPHMAAGDPWDEVRGVDADASAAAIPDTVPGASPAVAPGAMAVPLPPSRPAPPPVVRVTTVRVPLPPARPLAPGAALAASALAVPAAAPAPVAAPVSAAPVSPAAAGPMPAAPPEAAPEAPLPVHLAPPAFAPDQFAPENLAGESFTRASFALAFVPESFAANVFAGAAATEGPALPASMRAAPPALGAAPAPVRAAPASAVAEATGKVASSDIAEPSVAAEPAQTAGSTDAGDEPSAEATEPLLAEAIPEAPGLLRLPAVFSSAQASEVSAPGGAAKDEPAAASEPAAPPAPPLFRDVRDLQRLQDRMATGEPDALAAQNALIARIDAAFRAADASAWNDPQNARALIIFALSGGGPGGLRAVLGKGATPAIDERLLRGTLAYLEGREPEALKQLGEIEARDLPDSLAGQVALAQAALWVRRDPARAAVLLGRARLMAPGTLVEEAALRREIFIAAQANELDTFERLTATYLARYRHSVYAGNFRQRFAAALTRMSFIDSAEDFHHVHALLAPLEPESRRQVALLIAQAALAQGKTTAASLAAELVLKGAVIGSLEADRATLYRAAATVATPGRFDEARAELASVARERFGSEDARLLGAAEAVATSIDDAVNVPPEEAAAPPDAAPPDAESPDADAAAPPAVGQGGKDAPPPAILATARAALDAADKALGEAPL